MTLIVALFLGLMVSAEEIVKDRKILKREKFLNLSRSSYLVSKIIILFTISAIQSFLFVMIANSILGIKGMYFMYWFAMFSTAACANMLGLNISATFNSAVTIYILIPLLMIPMMVLSGAMFSFDKLNQRIGRVDKVPFVAEIMPTKWGFEALMVNQFKNNKFTKNFYELERQESIADFKKVYYLPEMRERLSRVDKELQNINQIDVTKDDLKLILHEIDKENKLMRLIEQEYKNQYHGDAKQLLKPVYFNDINKITLDNFTAKESRQIYEYLNNLEAFYSTLFQQSNLKRQNMITYFLDTKPEIYQERYDHYFNEGIADICKKVYEKNKIVEYKNQLVQHIDPIYEYPIPEQILSFRSHFLAPTKHFLNHYFDTYWFNMTVLWILTALCYIMLYCDILKKMLTLGDRLKRR
jgi:ABC-type transport system involved in multi-copper enzyme maturation permease subunit